MKRKIFIIRHGKSSWESVVNDIDRPLMERGVKNSYGIAHKLQDMGLVPEAIYSSPATRAFNTAIIMSHIWEVSDENFYLRNRLYLPELDDIYQVVYEIPDQYNSVAIFGHNPGFTRFANNFLDAHIDNLPTAGAVVLTLDIDSWTDISKAKVTEQVFEYPKKTD